MRQSSLSLSLSPQPKKSQFLAIWWSVFYKNPDCKLVDTPVQEFPESATKKASLKFKRKMENATKNKPQRDRERDREQTCHCLSSFHNGTNPNGPAVAKEVLKGEGLHIRQTERARKLSSRGATQDDGEEIHESEKNELKKMRWREREEQNWGLPPTNSGSVGSILGKEMEHEADSAMAERIVLARQHPLQLCCFDRSVQVHVRPAEFCDDFWICIRGKQRSLWRRIHLWWPCWSTSKWGLSVKGGSSSSSSLLLSIKSCCRCYCLVKFWRCWCWCSWVVAVRPVMTLLLLMLIW